jgi:hypothetical protein
MTETQNSKRAEACIRVSVIGVWGFGFVSDFEFRASDFRAARLRAFFSEAGTK